MYRTVKPIPNRIEGSYKEIQYIPLHVTHMYKTAKKNGGITLA